MKLGWDVGLTIKNKPIYREITPAILGVILDGGSCKRINTNFDIVISEEELQSIEAGNANFWFYISLAYTDVFKNRHDACFCWHWTNEDGSSQYYAMATDDVPEEYTRQT